MWAEFPFRLQFIKRSPVSSSGECVDTSIDRRSASWLLQVCYRWPGKVDWLCLIRPKLVTFNNTDCITGVLYNNINTTIIEP